MFGSPRTEADSKVTPTYGESMMITPTIRNVHNQAPELAAMPTKRMATATVYSDGKMC